MFVVFEGIDGSGKTTISNRVAKKLRDAGISVEHLREGGKFSSNVTQAIREFGRDARNLELTPHAEFFLYVTRDVQLLDEMTRPAIGRAEVVIADRYLYSAEILARFGRGLPESYVRPVLDAAARGLVPDLVVLIDVDPHIARARRQVAKVATQDKRPPSRKGLSGVGLQQRFRAGYHELAAREPERWVTFDNDDELDAIVERVYTLLADAAKHGVPAALGRHRAAAAGRTRPAPAPLASPDDALAAFLRWIDDRAAREPNVAAYFLSGLYGRGVDERRRALAEKIPEAILSAASGLDDPLSWELRRAFVQKLPAKVVRNVAGMPDEHPEVGKLRATLRDLVPLDVLASYETMDVEPAWTLREKLYDAHPDVVFGSITRLGSPRAWAIRDKWLAARGDAAFATYETARLVCKSIAWLDEERAWDLRKAARDIAPISALGSISGTMNSDRAWKWRERWIDRAPKTVFATLRHNVDPRGWPLRERLAPVCKEAIDSIQDLDSPNAWRLREQYADVWPSTVLKSLGPLAATPAGRRLAERQLRRYPGNISLLKHAAGIALGTQLASAVIVE